MTEKMTYEYNHATGEEIIRPATDEEMALVAGGANDKAKREAAEAIALASRESGRSKLMDLGLNEDEVSALLGKEPEPRDR